MPRDYFAINERGTLPFNEQKSAWQIREGSSCCNSEITNEIQNGTVERTS